MGNWNFEATIYPSVTVSIDATRQAGSGASRETGLWVWVDRGVPRVEGSGKSVGRLLNALTGLQRSGRGAGRCLGRWPGVAIQGVVARPLWRLRLGQATRMRSSFHRCRWAMPRAAPSITSRLSSALMVTLAIPLRVMCPKPRCSFKRLFTRSMLVRRRYSLPHFLVSLGTGGCRLGSSVMGNFST